MCVARVVVIGTEALDSDDESRREEVSRTPRKEALDAFALMLQEEQERIYREARTIADQVWQKRAEMKESNQSDRLGLFGVKVRKRTHGVSIEWFKHHFYKKSGGGWGVTFVYPRRGAKAKYDISAFLGAKDWELPVIEAAEETFAELRAYSAWLSKVGRLLAYHPDVRKSKTSNVVEAGRRTQSLATGDQDLDEETMGNLPSA